MEHFKTLEDLREYVKKLGAFYARPTEVGAHPTLYIGANSSGVVHGIRKRDYLFSTDENWVLPHNKMGLSFSAHWQHLKKIYRLKQKLTDGKSVNVYWVLEKADIPSGLEFLPDEKDKQHYLLVVTEKMRVTELADKLSWIADRMSVVRDGAKVL